MTLRTVDTSSLGERLKAQIREDCVALGCLESDGVTSSGASVLQRLELTKPSQHRVGSSSL